MPFATLTPYALLYQGLAWAWFNSGKGGGGGGGTPNKLSFGQKNPLRSVVRKNPAHNKEKHLQDSSHFITKISKQSVPGATSQTHHICVKWCNFCPWARL